MDILLQWLLLALAIAIGWGLGRWRPWSDGNKSVTADFGFQLPPGARFTFENYSDEAIDKYVQSLEVGRDTFPMHLSIASHFRQKGEVERAILIHQNLLASPLLDSDNRERAVLELARDYMSAGLLDRAEALLKQLERSRKWGERSLRMLLDIYQDEKEWPAAKEVALKLDPKHDRAIQKRLAHFCCEEAVLAQKRGDIQEMRRQLREALSHDRSCVRVSFMLADMHAQAGEYQEALHVLHKVEEQDPRFLPEAIPLLTDGYRRLGQEVKLQRYLAALLERSGSAHVLIAYAESLAITDGPGRALTFLSDQLVHRPSIRGLDRMLQWQISQVSPDERRRLESIQRVIQNLTQDMPQYQCESCGYSGRLLLWLCPSCKQWETIKPVQGMQGA